MNPIIGRRVSIKQNDRLVYVGVIIDSFWAPKFYRLVIEVEARYDGFPDTHDESKPIIIVPIDNGAHAFQAFVMPPPKVCKFCLKPMPTNANHHRICILNREAETNNHLPCEADGNA